MTVRNADSWKSFLAFSPSFRGAVGEPGIQRQQLRPLPLDSGFSCAASPGMTDWDMIAFRSPFGPLELFEGALGPVTPRHDPLGPG